MQRREKMYLKVKQDVSGNYSFDVSFSTLSDYTKEEVRGILTEINGEEFIECTVIRNERGKLLGLKIPKPKK